MRFPHLPVFLLLAPLGVFAAPQAKDANGANPTDIATPQAADGAIIDKTHATSGAASGVAPKDTGFLKNAQQAASAGSAPDARKRRPAPVKRGASSM